MWLFTNRTLSPALIVTVAGLSAPFEPMVIVAPTVPGLPVPPPGLDEGAVLEPPQACPFAPRCRYEVEESTRSVPPLEQIEPGHKVACFNPVPPDEWQRLREAALSA